MEFSGKISVQWLGQAGFIFRSSKGRVITVDPYLGDSCEELFGFKRLTPCVMRPDELKTDLLAITHHHEDHLDMETARAVMADGQTKLLGPPSVTKKCSDAEIGVGRLVALNRGESFEASWASITAVFSDHGESAPDALGFYIVLDKVKIYITGDTGYHGEVLRFARDARPDVLILPINGAYGNLDSREAALVAADSGAKTVIPCHFWTFREHGGDPQWFYDEAVKAGIGGRVIFMRQGERTEIGR